MTDVVVHVYCSENTFHIFSHYTFPPKCRYPYPYSCLVKQFQNVFKFNIADDKDEIKEIVT